MLATFPPSEPSVVVEAQPLQGETSSMVTGGAFWSWTGPHFERAATQSFWLPPTLIPYQEPCLSLKLHQTGKNKNQPWEKESGQFQPGPPSLKSKRGTSLWRSVSMACRSRGLQSWSSPIRSPFNSRQQGPGVSRMNWTPNAATYELCDLGNI